MGIPLGVALLAVLALLWRQRAHEQALKRKVEAWEEKYEALARSKGMDTQHFGDAAEMQPVVQSRRMNELETSQAPTLHEIDGVRDDRV